MNWNEYFMKVTLLTAQRSSCVRTKVGAILVNNNRIVSIGYNGLAPGMKPHCDEYFKQRYIDKYKDMFETFDDYLKSDIMYNEHGEYTKLKEIHAEQNCIGFGAQNGITPGCEMYLTTSPCSSCAKMIIAARIIRVFFIEEYQRDNSGIEILNDAGIDCKQLKAIT